MGAHQSKSSDGVCAEPPRHLKALRPRSSSLNLLKRGRTPSNSTRASCSLPVTLPLEGLGSFPAVNQEEKQTAAPSSQRSSLAPDSSSLSCPIGEVVEDDEEDDKETKSISETSSVVTATRFGTLTPTPIVGRTGSVSVRSDSRSSTPGPITTPKTLLPTPSVLPEDSPTKYGLQTTQTPSPEAVLSRAQRKDMAGPTLFAHTVETMKSYQGDGSQQSSQQGNFSHSSPCLLWSDGQEAGYANPLPRLTDRPSTSHSPTSLFKDGLFSHVAHAMPLKRSQMECFRNHKAWHAAAKPRHNLVHPVACAICDGYGTPLDGYEMAGDDFKRCDWCWMIVCGKCHQGFVKGGMVGMTMRQNKERDERWTTMTVS